MYYKVGIQYFDTVSKKSGQTDKNSRQEIKIADTHSKVDKNENQSQICIAEYIRSDHLSFAIHTGQQSKPHDGNFIRQPDR